MARGVEQRGDKIRISFMWQGKRVYETTHHRPTAAGIAAAHRLRTTIIEEIKYGTFSYRAHFPDSPRSKSDSSSFYELAKKFIQQTESRLAPSTVSSYRKAINSYWLPVFGETKVAAITTGHIREAIVASGLSELSGKTLNNAMTPLRGIFDLAIDYEVIDKDPCSKIKWQKSQRPPPDPLSIEEMYSVLNAIEPNWKPYFMVAFGTGMRTSELIELRWSDVDLKIGLIQVSRAYVEKQAKGTKTQKVRIIQLMPLAIAGLHAQKSKTMLEGGLVFTHLGKQINNDKPPRNAWTATLKVASIRYRKAYSTRHTFASHALMSGIPPYIVAEQLGNSVEMLMKHYAKWLPKLDNNVLDIYSAK